MKKILIAITALLLTFSCGAPDNTKGYGYGQTEHSKPAKELSRWDLPQVRRIGYNADHGYYIYMLEAEGHKFVIYREEIKVIE